MKSLNFILIDILAIAILMLSMVKAVDLNQPISSSDKAEFDTILSPVMKIYNLVKYSSIIIGALMLVFSGIIYMTSARDPKNRENAKSMAAFVIIGLALIWSTPFIIGFLMG